MSTRTEPTNRDSEQDPSASIVGQSPIMRQLLGSVRKIAELSGATVLIEGAVGTGKRLIASTLHRISANSGPRSLTWVDGASTTDLIVDSQVHEWIRAVSGPAVADLNALPIGPSGRSTLVVREVGFLSRATQAELLEWLDRAPSVPCHTARETQIIVTTSHDLAGLAERGAFLRPLYARLAALRILVPALCERHGDVEVLANYFLARIAGRLGTELEFDSETVHWLGTHSFPGNVSELRSVVERAALAAKGRVVSVGPKAADPIAPEGRDRIPFFVVGLDDTGRPPQLGWVEHAYAMRVLAYARGNRSETARVPGVSYPTIAKKVGKRSGSGLR